MEDRCQGRCRWLALQQDVQPLPWLPVEQILEEVVLVGRWLNIGNFFQKIGCVVTVSLFEIGVKQKTPGVIRIEGFRHGVRSLCHRCPLLPGLQDHPLGEQHFALEEGGFRLVLPLAGYCSGRLGFGSRWRRFRDHMQRSLVRWLRCHVPNGSGTDDRFLRHRAGEHRGGGMDGTLPGTTLEDPRHEQQGNSHRPGRMWVRVDEAGWCLRRDQRIFPDRSAFSSHFSPTQVDVQTVTVGKVYIVPTPLGNLDDMTFRAVRVLQEVDRILAEDTRHTHIVCARYAIATPMTSFNDHNAAHRLPGLLQALRQGARMALVTDAGTPGISDPGLPLIRAVVAEGIDMEVLPGASAVVTALSGSGFLLDRFVFEGFLPRKGKVRAERLAEIAAEERTVVLFESPLRLVATLVALQQAGCGHRPAVVARELTKLFETWHRGRVSELAEQFQTHPPRGEMVLVLKGREAETGLPTVSDALLGQILAEGRGMRAATQQMAQMTGLPRSRLYKMALDKKNKQKEEDGSESCGLDADDPGVEPP